MAKEQKWAWVAFLREKVDEGTHSIKKGLDGPKERVHDPCNISGLY